MKVVIIGATKGIGRSVARILAERGDSLFVLGRNGDELVRTKQDLEARRSSLSVGTAHCDLLDASTIGPALAEADRALGGFDTVVVTAGLFGTQEEIEQDAGLRDRVLQANFVGTIQFCEAAKILLLSRGGGRLCVLSSVAGEKARKPVVIYGATKAGLTAYLNGLDARHHADGLRVVVVKPGFVRTTMTANLPEPPFAGDVEAVAADIVKAIDRESSEIYTPWIWRWVMTAVRMLPRGFMRKAKF
ncbi:MAG: SDR family NAD(P)-dependent oxidoreductase [Candidatus Eisenbacteria bacterium]